MKTTDELAAEILDRALDDSMDTDYRVNATGQDLLLALRDAGFVVDFQSRNSHVHR